MFDQIAACALRAAAAVALLAGTLFIEAGAAHAARLAAYDTHACAIGQGGALRCWGSNSYGKLGDGSTTSRSTPVAVQGLQQGVTAVATGLDHTCAVGAGGKVFCWGLNTLGQLGTNGGPNSALPVEVTGVGGPAVDVKAAYYGTCALRADGAVRCWGYAADGRLGLGAATFAFSPATPAGLENGVGAISLGQNSLCAALTAGGIRCSGSDDRGLLGNGALSGTQTTVGPVSDVEDTVFVRLVHGHFHACALSDAGAVKCWGSNFDGAIGNNGPNGFVDTPRDVSGLQGGVADLGAGGSFTCAHFPDGSVKCWGGGASGELGTGNFLGSRVPVPLPGFPDGIASIGGGIYSNCAIDTHERLFCWGRNGTGLAGDGSRDRDAFPQAVAGLAGIVDIDVDLDHACAVTASGGAYCWGRGTSGMIGDGARMQRLLPTGVVAVANASAVTTGGLGFACAIDGAAALRCWGSNANYVLGTGEPGNGNPFPPPSDAPSPITVAGLTSGVTAVDSNYWHSCAVQNGAAKCWGDNFSGQLGNGTGGSGTTPFGPVAVSGLGTGVASVATGGGFSCALKDDGNVACWGNGGNGELGNGANAPSFTPVGVANLSDVVQISAGYFHACALDGDGIVACWGANTHGELGVAPGALANSNVPATPVSLPAPAVAIASGWYHNCARLDDGRMFCWGRNDLGQLGDGTFTNRPTPVPVAGLGNVGAIGAGGSSTCAVNGGAGYCWGSNTSGQLGNDAAGNYASPRRASGFPIGPSIVALSPPADGYYRAGSELDFEVVYSAAVTATGTPSLRLRVAGAARAATLVGGNGTAATPLRFRYTVQPGDADGTIEFAEPAIDLDGGTLVATDFPDAPANPAFVAPDLDGIFIDTTAPFIVALTRADANPTNAISVDWLVQFSEAIPALATSDLTLVATGLPGANVVATSQVSPSTWRVTAATGSGSGSLALDVGIDVADVAGNPMTQTFTGGEVYALVRDLLVAIETHTPDPSLAGAAVSVTWSVLPAIAGSPAGDVRITDGVDACMAPVAAGACALTLHTPGTRLLQAQFTSADALYADSASATVPHQVTGANSLPSAVTATLDLLEDQPLSTALEATDADGEPLSFQIVESPQHGELIAFDSSTGAFTYLPDADFFGTDALRFTAADAEAASAPATVTFTIGPVNDAPTLGPLANRNHVAGGTTAHTVPDFATPLGFGPNESSQSVLDYELQVTDPRNTLSHIDIDNAGTLSYNLSGGSGSARIAVVLIDDGGTANGGVARSAVRSFDIRVAAAADVRVTIDNGRSGVLPGDAVRYLVTVENFGPDAVAALRIDSGLSPTLADVLWSCVSPDAVCRDAAGTDAPSLETDLQSGGMLQIEVLARVDAGAGAFVEAEAQATIPAGVETLNAHDDRDTDTDPIQPYGVFSNGFE